MAALCSVLALALLVVLPSTTHAVYHRQTLNAENWKLSNVNGTVTCVAPVPGLVGPALMASGVLKGAPEYRFNAEDWSWLASETWSYSRTFEVPADILSSPQHSLLIFDSIDTIAHVWLNGNLLVPDNHDGPLLHNAFYRYIFVLDGLKGTNSLRVDVFPPLSYAKFESDRYSYDVPETNFHTWAELPNNGTHRNFVRKTASDFGWDWGPALVPAGIPGNVWIDSFISGHLQKDFTHLQTHGSDGSVLLVVTAVVHSRSSTPGRVRAQVEHEGRLVAQAELAAPLVSGLNTYSLVLNVEAVDAVLWWPAGYGGQPLYNITVQFIDGADQDVQSSSKSAGLRTVELVQEPLAASPDGLPGAGTSFYFKVNGLEIFAKGGNWIPTDVYSTRVTQEKLRWQLESAVKANMNMVRVWGGGMYQTDQFYQLADELGLMVWQEMMFACALYPRDERFLTNVAEEIHGQVLRLQNHPSIVIWGGSNENEVAIGWYTRTDATLRDRFVVDFEEFYVDTIRPALRAVDPLGSRPFVDSSPSNGVISRDPYVKRWLNPFLPEYGDVHYYDYTVDCEDYTTYPKARFVSEHGFQSFPSFEAYLPVTEPQDWARNSTLMQWRQRHPNGNAQVDAMMARHFRIPPLAPSTASLDAKRDTFASYLWLTQVQQARCYETAFAQWRRLKSHDAKTMGVLYWQLNDIWQGPSWSSMEFDGSWRLVQYFVARVFAPVLVSGVVDKDSQAVVVSVTSDEVKAINTTVHIELLAWSGGKAVKTWSAPVSLSPLESNEVWRQDISGVQSGACTEATDCYLRLSLDYDGTPVGNVWLSQFKDAKLPPVLVEVSRPLSSGVSEASMTVTANATAAFVTLSTELPGSFSDNGFLLSEGESVDVRFSSPTTLDVKSLADSLTVRSLRDTY